ncbi:LysR family transcriptional regulator [Burkholderia sp. RF2-non_BP3]|uniref:LysR family transcriptional regulator n=1 Tax=Burkholderia sp. RF2-non_BP3 TaxID=1637844 RepID=UPI0009E98EDB|nr:LysR family transcriptional regulator [Burkholderia sp. RF2-non_BP3]
MDTSRVLSIFLAVAKAKSFTQAAQETGVVTGVVSRSIAQLEAHLGVRLLNRTTRRVSLTDEGQQLFDLADAGLSLLEEAMDKTRYASKEVKGNIRISAPRSLAGPFVLPCVAGFQRLHPDVHFEFILDDHFTDLVEARIDVGFRVGTEPTQNVVVRPLGRFPLIICASPEYVARNGQPKNLEELVTYRCTGFRHPNSGRAVPWEVQVNDELVYHDVPASMIFNDIESEANAVRLGMGIGQLPAYTVEADIRAGTLVQLLPEHVSSRLGVFMYYPQRQRIPSRVREFIDYAVDNLQLPEQ